MKAHIDFARNLVRLMDTKFKVFGIRFGIDPLLDLWPWFGSVAGALISCYLLWIAYRLRVPRRIYWRMGWHIFLDLLLGAIPYIGSVFDLFYRANKKNLALLTPFFNPDVLEGVVVES